MLSAFTAKPPFASPTSACVACASVLVRVRVIHKRVFKKKNDGYSAAHQSDVMDEGFAALSTLLVLAQLLLVMLMYPDTVIPHPPLHGGPYPRQLRAQSVRQVTGDIDVVPGGGKLRLSLPSSSRNP